MFRNTSEILFFTKDDGVVLINADGGPVNSGLGASVQYIFPDGSGNSTENTDINRITDTRINRTKWL